MKAAAFVMLLAGVVHAAPPSPQEELARSHYVAGEEEYARGHWNEALREFQAGYELAPRPEFLINFAQVHRRLGDYDRAIAECERYLATGPEASLAAQAQRLLQQLREEKARVPNSTPPPAPPPPTVTATAPTPALATTAPPPPRPRRRRWVVPVAVTLAVVAAAGIVVGIVFAAQPRDTYPSTPLGTVDFNR